MFFCHCWSEWGLLFPGQVISHQIETATILVSSNYKWQNNPCLIIEKENMRGREWLLMIISLYDGTDARATLHLDPSQAFNNNNTHSRHHWTIMFSASLICGQPWNYACVGHSEWCSWKMAPSLNLKSKSECEAVCDLVEKLPNWE